MNDSLSQHGEDDTPLVERLKAGDADAFEQMVRLYGPRLLAVARRMLRNEEDAQDALQDGLLQAFRKIDSFKGDAKLSTWLHRVVVNASLMKLRHMRSRPSKSIEDLLPRYQPDGHRIVMEGESSTTGADVAQQKETNRIVRHAIDQLPDDYRTVVLLRDVEQLDTKETADELGVSTAVVKTRLHRARQALRGLLDGHLQRGAV